MKKSNRAFIIQFAGLKIGKHDYEFDLDQSFFESIENTLIENGSVQVALNFEKKETMMVANYSFNGFVHQNCDRCNDPIELAVSGENRIVFKFGNELSDDEDLIILDPDAYEIDITAQLYEIISVALPIRCIHPPGECNEEMMALYSTYIVNANTPDEDEDDLDDWDEDDEDWDNDDNSDDDSADDSDDTDDEPDFDPNKPIDPRWSVLKNLN